MDNYILNDFTNWINSQSSPKSKRDKEEYITRSTDAKYHPLDKFTDEFGKGLTLPEASLTDLYKASLMNDFFTPKGKSIINKCIAYKISYAEADSPSVEKTGDGLSIHSLISAIHRARKKTKENGYNHILSALMLVPSNVFPYDRTDDHIRPEKSDKYKLYRHIMLFNLSNRIADVTSALVKSLAFLFSEDEKPEISNIILPLKSVGQSLLEEFENKAGFKGSAVHYLLLQLTGAASVAEEHFSFNEKGSYYANLIARLSVIALNNQGRDFQGERLPHCTNEDDAILFTLLSPFAESLTVKLVGDAKLMDNKYIKHLLYQGLIYPTTLKGSKYPRLVTAGGYESALPQNNDGINFLRKIKNYPEMEKILHALLSEIYNYQIKELEMLFENKTYKIDRGLFTFPKELVTLLASFGKEDTADKKNLKLETLLTKVLAVAHWVCSRLLLTGTKERFESEFRLAKLLVARPVTVSKAIENIPDFFDKIKDAEPKNLLFNKRKENILLARIKLSASEDALGVASSALAAENYDVAEYYITTSLKLSKDAKGIALSLGDIFTAADSSSLCAEGYANLAIARHKEHSATMLLCDSVIPASKCLYDAEELLESVENPESTEFSISKRCYSEAVEFCSDTFYSPSSPIFNVLSSDESIKIPFTLDYSILKEHSSRLKLDEIPEDIRKSAHTWIPHKREKGQFFRPFYITDFDSELTVRKNLGPDKIQPLLMKSVLSGNTIKLTANQLADNPELLRLSESPGFLTLLQKGYVSLSLYGNVNSLREYVASSFKKQSFIFSSLPELNYYGENPDSKEAAAIMKKRLLAMDYISGKKDISAIPSTLRESLSLYKDRITLLDENLPTASRYYNYQRPFGVSLSFSEQMDDFFEERKSITKFSSLYRIHNIIKTLMPESYERSLYKLYTDRIEKGNLNGLNLSVNDKNFLLSFAEKRNTKNRNAENYDAENHDAETSFSLMDDILTECQNTVLGSRVSPHIHYTYRKESKLLLPEPKTMLNPITGEGNVIYNDVLRVDETGETIDFEALFSHLSFMERNIKETGDAFLPDKVAYTLSNPSLSYSIGKEGALLLDEAKFQITSGENISVANSDKDTSDSTLHLERNRRI